jgi:hypothetical protein
MLTPAINFNNYSNEVMNFRSSMMDYDDNNTFIYLKYSTNYSGTGNPNNASWTDISSQADWSLGDYEWTESGEIDLSNINGTSVHLAFVYVSENGSGKTWQIDDVSITVDGTANNPPQITNVDHTPAIPQDGEAVTVSATITDDNSVASAELMWGFSSSNINQNVVMNASGNNYSAQIPGQSAGVQVFFKIKATDNDGAVAESSIESYTVATSTNLPPEISDVSYSPATPEEGESVTVEAEITDDEEVESAIVLWGLSASALNNIENMSVSGNTYSATIPGQNAGAGVFFKLQAFDNEGEMSETSVYQYTVNSPLPIQSLPFLETFESEDLGIFNSYSVSGDNEWHNDDYNGNHFAKMSNYDGSENLENEDWLLTNAINFNNYSNEVLNFESALMDYDDNTTFIYLKYSTNYDGVSDPNTANWMDITNQAEWSNGDYEWTASGDIDLSGISGTAVYLAFVYESEDGSGKTWEIDNVSVSLEGANEAPVISNISQNPMNPDQNDIVTISALINDDSEVEVAEIQYGFSAGQMNNIVDMIASGNSFTGEIPAQDANQYIYYRIMAIDDEGATTYSSISNYYVDVAQGLESTSKMQALIYPNPASHSFRIQTQDLKNGELQVLHSSGKLVMQIPGFATDQHIDISGLSSGSYLVRFINKEEALIFNLIVQ